MAFINWIRSAFDVPVYAAEPVEGRSYPLRGVALEDAPRLRQEATDQLLASLAADAKDTPTRT